MQRLLQLAGYVALLAPPVALLSQAYLASTLPVHIGIGSSVALIGALTAETVWEDVFERNDRQIGRADSDAIIAVTASAVVTYVLSVHAGLGPVVASSLVGVVVGLGVPEVDTAGYCGSFVGMVSPTVFHSIESIVLAGLLTGFAFIIVRGTFAGFGGKLGTLALFGCATTGLLTGVHLGAEPQLQQWSALRTVPVAVAGAVATVVLSKRCEFGAVLGSALVGLVVSLLLPVVLPGIGELFATVAFCASFVGMSSTERLENEVQIGIAGALCGVIFVVVAPAFVGVGGKLGTTAFISCVVFFRAREFQRDLVSRIKSN